MNLHRAQSALGFKSPGWGDSRTAFFQTRRFQNDPGDPCNLCSDSVHQRTGPVDWTPTRCASLRYTIEPKLVGNSLDDARCLDFRSLDCVVRAGCVIDGVDDLCSLIHPRRAVARRRSAPQGLMIYALERRAHGCGRHLRRFTHLPE